MGSALAIAALTTAACAPGAIGQDITRDLAEQTIQGDPLANAAATAQLRMNMGAAPVVSLESDVAAQDTTGLNWVLLRSVSMEITGTARPAGDADCWDFVQGVTVYVESTRQGSTLPRMQIASATAPGCVGTMNLTPVASANLKPYTDEGFRLTAEAMGVPPTDDVTFVTHLVLRAAVF